MMKPNYKLLALKIALVHFAVCCVFYALAFFLAAAAFERDPPVWEAAITWVGSMLPYPLGYIIFRGIDNIYAIGKLSAFLIGSVFNSLFWGALLSILSYLSLKHRKENA